VDSGGHAHQVLDKAVGMIPDLETVRPLNPLPCPAPRPNSGSAQHRTVLNRLAPRAFRRFIGFWRRCEQAHTPPVMACV
jgi:hypothetical protein